MKKLTGRKMTFCATAMSILLASSCIADTVAAYHEGTALNIAQGQSEALDGRLTTGDGGTFYKIGAGTLTLQQAQINRNAPYSVTALEGTLVIEPGNATTDVASPEVVSSEAAFWVDATAGNGLQTIDDNGTTRVTRWCDRREADPSNRMYASALPDYKKTGRSTDVGNVKPCVTTINGKDAVYFGGIGSGQYMWYKDASDTTLKYTKVFHFFVVHGIDSANPTWGAALGCDGTDFSNGFRVNTWTGNSFTAFDQLQGGHFLGAADVADNGAGLLGSRFSLNGHLVDAFAVSPRKGIQLLSGSVGNTFQFQHYNNFFRQRTNSNAIGGDYICEAILFTNRLSEVEVASVERYLMAKWEIPNEVDGLAHLDADVGRIGIAKNAVVSVSTEEGVETGPMAFSGEGKVIKSGSGDLVIGPSGDNPPFAGDVEFSGGRIVIRGGMSPSIAVAGGETVDADYITNSDLGSPTKDQQVEDGTAIGKLANGTSGVFSKTGNGELRVKTVANDIEKIQVSAGTLVLAAPTSAAAYSVNTWGENENMNVSIPNAGFEEYFIANPDEVMLQSKNINTEYNSWHMTGWQCYFINSAVSTWASSYCKADISPAEGSSVLYLKTYNATAYTTCVIPKAGVYEFSCVSTANKSTDGATMGVWFGTTWNEVEQIGTLPDGPSPWPRTYCRFTVDEPGNYVLGFKTGSDATTEYGWLVDDLKLRYVTEAGMADELVANGGFEKAGGYSSSSYNQARVAYVNSNIPVSGYNAYEGGYCQHLTKNGWVSWPLSIPEAGLYRLRFAAHSRTASRGANGKNPIKATLTDSQGKVAELLRVTPIGCNFYEYSSLFSVAEPGEYTLKLEGMATDDRRSYIDGVSVRRSTAVDVPSVPIGVGIEVVEGARLHLDYPGQMRVRALSLGGERLKAGTYRAADYPDYLTGMGEVKVVPEGFTMVVW